MSRDKKRRDDDGPTVPDWIVTFSDMVSLLVTFFILLLTFSSMEEHQVLQMPRDLLGRKALLKDPKDPSLAPAPEADLMSEMDPEGEIVPHARPSEHLEVDNQGKTQRPDDKEIDLNDIGDGIVILYDERASFGAGSAEPNGFLRQSLIELARVVENYPVQITVEGFTDNQHSPTPRFPTSEALATSRAAKAAELMLANSRLSPQAVQIAGLGAERPRNGNTTAIERTLNRRVEIRIARLPSSRARREEPR